MNDAPISEIKNLIIESKSIENGEKRIALQNDLFKTLILGNKQQLVVYDRFSLVPTKEEIQEAKNDCKLLQKFKLNYVEGANFSISAKQFNKNVLYERVDNMKLYKKIKSRDSKNNILNPLDYDNLLYTSDMNAMMLEKNELIRVYKKYMTLDNLVSELYLAVLTCPIDLIKKHPAFTETNGLRLLLKKLTDDYENTKLELEFKISDKAEYKEVFKSYILSEDVKKRIYRLLDKGLINYVIDGIQLNLDGVMEENNRSDDELLFDYSGENDDFFDDKPFDLAEYRVILNNLIMKYKESIECLKANPLQY